MPKKLVLIHHMADGTGFSQAGNRTALGLDAAGFDVVCKPIKLASQYVEPIYPKLKELCLKDPAGAEIVVQHTLPNMMSYYHGFKNIGYGHFETDHFTPSGWQHYLNLMDEVWVCSEQNKESCIKSGVRKPIRVIPIPADLSIYTKQYHKFNFGNRYKFYHIGDYSTRKNTVNLIACYLETFSKADNVVLVLKSYVESTNTKQSFDIINEDIKKLKESLRKSAVDIYPPIVIIPDYLTEQEVLGIHQSCDCFVSLERGAAFNLPAFDAIAFNKWCIVNGWGGQKQFIKGGINGDVLPYTMRSVGGMTRCPYQNLYTCHEKWADPDLESCKTAMRRAYQSKPSPNNYNKEIVESFSISNFKQYVGDLL